MDEQSKDYLLNQAMVSIASFAAASRMARKKLDNLVFQPGGIADMSTEDVLKYLLDFMDIESEKMFKEYDSCSMAKVSRDTTYIELIPEAPFNPEDKKSTIEQLRYLCECDNASYHLIQVYDDKGKPKFITIEEFEKNYYEYWEPVLRMFDYTEEQIENFKQGKQ
jgi:hypothetical protein